MVSGEMLSRRLSSLASDVRTDGQVTDPAWLTAIAHTPRHLFVPRLVWRYDEDLGRWTVLDADTSPDAWLDLAYSDTTIVTQLTHGAEELSPGARSSGWPSSSSTFPSLVGLMLQEAQIRDGHRVLEIGTGTGYSTALLCHRLGNRSVTSVEIDPAIARRARQALAVAGRHPTLVTGEGERGHPDGAPFDRIVATCAIRHVPAAWLDQLHVGAQLLFPWAHNISLPSSVLLTAHGDGTASGHFLGDGAAFMRSRRQYDPLEDRNIGDLIDSGAPTVDHETTISPFVMDHMEALFCAELAVPDLTHVEVPARDGSGETSVWFVAHDRLSWACVDFTPGKDTYAVAQHGPRRLWDEVEAAVLWWYEAGQPEQERFGLSVTPDGQQAWLDSPVSGHVWNLPRPASPW